MASIRFEIRQGDYGRTLSVQVQNADGSAIPPIPGGSTLTWTMVNRAGHTVTGAGFVTGSNSDILNYSFASGDTAKPGIYTGLFKVTYAGGAGIETFPTCSDPTDSITVEVCPLM
jgi:hypothetical protein